MEPVSVGEVVFRFTIEYATVTGSAHREFESCTRSFVTIFPSCGFSPTFITSALPQVTHHTLTTKISLNPTRSDSWKDI